MLTTIAALSVLSLLAHAAPAPAPAPDVDTTYPYLGPKVPIGDPLDQVVQQAGNGKGFARLTEPPAVQPTGKVTNNINVISTAYIPDGMNIHFQTAFGIGGEPCVNWGEDPNNLCKNTKGATRHYDRTPSCAEYDAPTQCSEYFHDVQLSNLEPGKTYYYQIPGGNGTQPSQVLSFKTSLPAGCAEPFSVGIINDMGYTNAHGTHKQLIKTVDEGTAFLFHGGDTSYADQWYAPYLACSDWPVCYNGSSTHLPGNLSIPEEYLKPLPAGEIPNQGGPQGGDISTIYEANWDLWQQWMNNVTLKVPYMILPGNHEAACAEFDGDHNELSAVLDQNLPPGSTANKSTLNYWSCPPSQRNFTAYQYRFRMPGQETGGRSNFWYSFDYGLAHFLGFDSETDFPQSPSYTFAEDIKGNETFPMQNETFVTDAGPFGYINGSFKVKENYEQYQFIKNDLASVNRTETPWVFVMSHRPLYSSQTSSYQTHLRNAFEQLFLEYGVDAYFAGHIHWYERIRPMNNGTIVTGNEVSNNTVITGNGKAVTYLTNGQAGNVESHSELNPGQPVLNLTAVLNKEDYGFSKLTVENATHAHWQFVKGSDGSDGDYVTFVKSA